MSFVESRLTSSEVPSGRLRNVAAPWEPLPAVALDTTISQKQYWGADAAVKCICVAIGQTASTVAAVVETLRENGALEYTTVVNAAASDPAPFQYVAPYSGAALGALSEKLWDELVVAAQIGAVYALFGELALGGDVAHQCGDLVWNRRDLLPLDPARP